MIVAIEDIVKIDGKKVEVLSEATLILHHIYETLAEHEGTELAEEDLRQLFILAMTPEEELAEMARESKEERREGPEDVNGRSDLVELEPSRYAN